MKIGVMNNPSKSVYDEAIAFGEAHFDYIDLTIEGPRARDIDPDKMRSILERYHLFVTGHTDPCLPYAYPVDAIRRACLAELERCARVFSALGATVMNIHPCYFCPPAMRSQLVQLNIEALKSIVEMAAAYGLTVVFENYKAPFDHVSTFTQLVEKVPGLGMHLDFGHTNMGKDDYAVFCKQLGEHIEHVHFSDNRGTGDHHMPLGVGSIDWKRAVQSLKRIGYDGTITLEVFCDDSGMLFQYLDLSRKLLLDLWSKTATSD